MGRVYVYLAVWEDEGGVWRSRVVLSRVDLGEVYPFYVEGEARGYMYRLGLAGTARQLAVALLRGYSRADMIAGALGADAELVRAAIVEALRELARMVAVKAGGGG